MADDKHLQNITTIWVLLNLWFAKPMVCMQVAFHENDGNHEKRQNDEDNSESYKEGVDCWICRKYRKHGNDEKRGNPGCKPRVPPNNGLRNTRPITPSKASSASGLRASVWKGKTSEHVSDENKLLPRCPRSIEELCKRSFDQLYL